MTKLVIELDEHTARRMVEMLNTLSAENPSRHLWAITADIVTDKVKEAKVREKEWQDTLDLIKQGANEARERAECMARHPSNGALDTLRSTVQRCINEGAPSIVEMPANRQGANVVRVGAHVVGRV